MSQVMANARMPRRPVHHEEWDVQRLKDLYRGVPEQDNRSKNLSEVVFQRIAADFRDSVHPTELVPLLHCRGLLTRDELDEITNSDTTPQRKNTRLLTILPSKVSRHPGDFLDFTYLALLDSVEKSLGVGLQSHVHVAALLRSTVKKILRVDEEKQEKDAKDLHSIVLKLPPVEVKLETATAFMVNLGLTDDQQRTISTNIQEICLRWIELKGQQCSLHGLVMALLCTYSLGYLVSDMLPPCYSNPPEVYKFVRLLTSWTGFASYLGYSDDCIGGIQGMFRYSLKSQCIMFLRMWQMPDCGPSETQRIIDEVIVCGEFQVVTEDQATQAPEKIPWQALEDTKTVQPRALPSSVGSVRQLYQASGHMMNFYIGTNGNCPAILPPAESILVQPAATLHPDVDYSEPQLLSCLTVTRCPQTVLTTPQVKHDQQPPSVSTSDSATVQVVSPTEMVVQDIPIPPEHTITLSEGYDLLQAVMNQEWELVETLVKTGSPVECKSAHGKTPLVHACVHGEQSIVQLLLDNGANLGARDYHGSICLHLKEVLKRKEMVQFLLPEFQKRRLSVDVPTIDTYNTPLMMASLGGRATVDTAILLLDHGAIADGNPKAKNIPLVAASAGGDINLVGALLAKRARIDLQNGGGCTALIQACMCNHFNIAKKLLHAGADVNKKDESDNTPLTAAVSGNSFEIVKELLGKSASVNVSRFMTNDVIGSCVEVTPLSDACARGFLSIAKLLIEHGANVNYLGSHMIPPLGFAIICKQKHIIRVFLADSSIGLNKGIHAMQAPFILAVKVYDNETAGLLLADLGGPERAYQLAKENNFYDLAEHIRWYQSTTQHDGVYSKVNPIPESAIMQHHVAQATVCQGSATPDHSRLYGIFQRFCQICISSFLDGNKEKSHETLIEYARMECDDNAAAFFQRSKSCKKYLKRTKRPENLNQDFLGGNPSPAMFLIRSKLLTMEFFIVHAHNYYPDDINEFWQSLVGAFHQTPGGEHLPDDIHRALDMIFSGQFSLNIQIAKPSVTHHSSPPPRRKQGGSRQPVSSLVLDSSDTSQIQGHVQPNQYTGNSAASVDQNGVSEQREHQKKPKGNGVKPPSSPSQQPCASLKKKPSPTKSRIPIADLYLHSTLAQRSPAIHRSPEEKLSPTRRPPPYWRSQSLTFPSPLSTHHHKLNLSGSQKSKDPAAPERTRSLPSQGDSSDGASYDAIALIQQRLERQQEEMSEIKELLKRVVMDRKSN